MANRYENPDELRKLLRQPGFNVSEFARKAGVSKTTLFSFLDGSTANMRSDTLAKVLRTLERQGLIEAREDNDKELNNIVRLWDHMDSAQRRLLSETAKSFAKRES